MDIKTKPNYYSSNIDIPKKISNKYTVYSESKTDNFPNGNSPNYSYLNHYINCKLIKNNLSLDNIHYDKYKIS